jgi:polysaccharide chain length determinant protein (PEP-CTERM system associated)
MDGTRTTQDDSFGNFSAYLEVARRRKWWIILSVVSVFVCATVCAKRLPNIYRAETVILVDSAQVPDKYVATINTGDIAGRLTTLQQQVLSPTRLKRLAESEGLYPNPSSTKTEEQMIQSVQKSIVVEVVNPGAGKLSAFRIAYSSRDKNKVAPIANRLAQMFIEENLAARVNITEDTAQFFRDQLDETKKELDAKDSQLAAIKSRNLNELPESKPYHMEALANLRTQAQMIQDKVSQAQREKGVMQSMMMSGEDAPTVDVGGNSSSGGGPASAYETQIAKLESKLSELRGRYGPGHPDVRRTQDEINRLKAKAAAEPKAAPGTVSEPAIVAQPQRKRRNPVLEAQIQKLDEEIQEQTKLLQPLQAQMAFHESKLQQIPAFEQQIARLQQDYDSLKVQYIGLLDKEKAAEISHALEVHQKGERFEVLDAASTPTSPAAPNRALISIAGLLGGLFAGIVLAAIAEMNDESVRSEVEASRILGKPVLTSVPQIVSAQERRAWRIRTAGVLAGTIAGSVALGFLLSIVAGGLF